MEDNIKEIQELYTNEEINSAKGMVENEEVILVQPYQVDSTTTSSFSSSFISNEIDNLEKYMKFVKTPSQTRILRPPYYQSLKSRGEQDPSFWKEVVTAFLDKKKIPTQQGMVAKYLCTREGHHMNPTLSLSTTGIK